MKEIILDNHIITRPDPEVISAMLPFLHEKWGSSTSPHRLGQQLLPALREAYESFYALMSVTGEERFIFTSSGTEAINQVIFSVYLNSARKSGKNHFVTSEVEEAPIIMAQNRLEEMGCSFTMAKVNANGVVTKDAILESITARSALVSISTSSALLGTLHEIDAIATLCKQRGILFHIDVSHALLATDFTLLCDFVTFSGDLIHGPRGSGGLFVKAGVELSPFIVGGNEQNGLRAGVLDVPSFIGLAEAAHLILAHRDHFGTEVTRLRSKLESLLIQKVPGATVLFNQQERLPHVSLIAFEGVSNEALLYRLNKAGVTASFGGGRCQQISHLLKACGVHPRVAQTALSFALSRSTTEREIEEGAHKIAEAALVLQRGSKHLPEECLR